MIVTRKIDPRGSGDRKMMNALHASNSFDYQTFEQERGHYIHSVGTLKRGHPQASPSFFKIY